MTARAYTGPWPIRSHRTLAELPPVAEPRNAAGEVLPPVYTGQLPPPEPEADGLPLSYVLLIGFALLYVAMMLVEAAGR